MRKVATFVIALIVAASVAHAHGGKPHLLGTVELADTTKLEKAGKAATRADLVAGVRVAVHFAADGKTAQLIRISPAAPR